MHEIGMHMVARTRHCMLAHIAWRGTSTVRMLGRSAHARAYLLKSSTRWSYVRSPLAKRAMLTFMVETVGSHIKHKGEGRDWGMEELPYLFQWKMAYTHGTGQKSCLYLTFVAYTLQRGVQDYLSQHLMTSFNAEVYISLQILALIYLWLHQISGQSR